MIHNFHIRGKHIQLTNPQHIHSYANTFSILVGKNGTGKSTMLGNLVSELIQEHRHQKRHNLFEENISNYFPHRIIAASTSPFDKFPIDRFDKDENYTYLGLRDLGSSNFGLAYLSKIIASLIESVSKDSQQAFEIGRVLDYLGYRSEIWISFQMFNSKKFFEELLTTDNYEDLFYRANTISIRRLNKSFFFNKDSSISERKIYRLKNICHKILEGNYISNFDLYIGREGINIDFDESEDILFLIQAGILRLKDVKLQSFKDKEQFSIKDASSGEQSIILSILGIASKIKDNSLICIDEPEICLHPQWQEKYIEILTTTFQNYRNCHFIIATHSPQIVAKLSNINSFIVDMESGITKQASEFINHSADYQLANVFDSPGFKNEYLSRIALNIFSKVSKNKSFDTFDLQNYQILDKQSNFLSHNDPVYDLYITIKKLFAIYG